MAHISRRTLLRRSLAASTGAFLVACTPKVEKEIVRETVMVQGTPKVVEKEVTKVVEKVVTAAPQVRKVTAAGSLPIVKDKITLKVLALGGKDFNDNAFTKWLEEQTNIDIEYDMAIGPDAQQKLNLTVASGNLPDVIAFFNVSLADQQILAQQGVIIPLDDLIEEYGFETKRLFREHPEIRPQVSLFDGKIYDLPSWAEVVHMSLCQKMWVYQPWLTKLGLKMPETTEDFYQMLKAFKTKDPNGNGKADEIPLSGGVMTGYASLDRFLMQPFVFNNRMRTKSLMVDKDTIKASYTEPGWREGLRYLNKLYAEGLMDPQAFSNDSTALKALGENADAPILGACTGHYWGSFTVSGGASGRWKQYRPVPPLKGPTGLQQIPWDPYQPLDPGKWLITKACKNREAAFRLGDYFYSWDATMRNVWGVKDLDWRLGKPGEVGVDGGPAVFALLRAWATDPKTFINTGPSYQPASMRNGLLVVDPDDRLEEYTEKVYKPYGVQDKILPWLLFTPDQSKQLGELTTGITNYIDQSFAEFVTGKLSIDKDWDTYLKRLKDLGLDKYLKLHQDVYNSRLKK